MSQQAQGCSHEFKTDECLIQCSIGIKEYRSDIPLADQLDHGIDLQTLSNKQKDDLIRLLAAELARVKTMLNQRRHVIFC